MKKTLFKSISLAIVAIAAMVGVSSCKPDNSGNIAGLEISAVSTTFNAVTFSVNAEPAVAIAYICVPRGERLTSKEIFEKGTATSTVKGVFSVKNLKPETKYTLLVAKRNTALEGPAWYDIETTPNNGTPPTPVSAGIRVESVDKSNVKFEIMNGAEADYSYVGVWPEVYLENFLFEAEKTGQSREDYLRDLITGYPYLCGKVVGRGKSTMFDYLNDFNSEAKTSKLWPAADYMIISVGMQGDPDMGKDGKPGDVVIKKVRTENFDMQGIPTLAIDTLYTDYIRVRYKFRPGADAACYAFFATKKAEIDEFVNHYDADRGAGQGEAMLKEFIRFSDPYVAEHTDVLEYSLTYGFDQGGIDFEMIGVPMDRNLMPGDMVRRVDQVRPTPPNQVDAVFEWNIDPDDQGVGATNFWYQVKFGKNCGNIFWRLTTKSEYDAAVAKMGLKGYARDLWSQGWGEDRPANPNRNQEHVEKHFRWGEMANKECIIVATGLNYTGGLSDPKIVATFKTKPVILEGGAAKPQMKVETVAVGKTSATFRYYVPKDVDPNVPRVLRHIVLEEGDPVLDLTDMQFKDMLYRGREMSPTLFIIGNEWSVYSIDLADQGHEYDWQWNWTSMVPGKKYVHVYLTEDKDGKFSELDRVDFQTARNDGGANPRVTIEIDKASIETNENDKNQWGCAALFTPNGDVVTYSLLFIDRKAFESWEKPLTPKADFEEGLMELLMAQGMTGYVDPVTIRSYNNAKGYECWITAITYGAGNAKGALTYREVRENGTVGELIESKLPDSYSVKFQQTAPLRGLNELKARNERARANIVGIDVAPPFAAGEPQAYEQMNPQPGELKVRSMKEITMDVLTRGNYKK